MKGPLYRSLVEHVEERIRAGELRAGDRVPSEHELARSFGVSRITAKRALDELATLRLIERVRGKGSFVLPAAQQRMDTKANAAEGRLVGLLLPDFSETFGLRLVHAVETRCREHGAHMVLRRTFGDAGAEVTGLGSLTRLGVDGLIVFPVHGEHYNPELLKRVIDGFPIVLVDRYLQGIPACSVETDNDEAARVLTRHLLARGHRRVAFVSPPPEHTSTIEDRLAGFTAALNERKLLADDPLVLHCTLPGAFIPELIARDEERVRSYLDDHPDVTAFVASEHNLALVLTHVLLDRGRSVPGDAAVACFDAPHQPLQDPLFTHVAQDEGAMGAQAVDLLVKQFHGTRIADRHLLDFALVEGRSTSSERPSSVTRDEIDRLRPSVPAID